MRIRQAAFAGRQRMLKGGLHCHTTRSDGIAAPEEIIDLYAESGYVFLALTDIRFYNRKNYVPEGRITIIPGMEFDATFEGGWEKEDYGFRSFHTVSIGPDDGSNGILQDQRFASGEVTGQEGYQPYLDWFHENNNLTIYCHPQWSGTPVRYFEKMNGNFAIEVWNSASAREYGMDTNAAYWDELLEQGHRIFGVAVDDAHSQEDCCKGWVMVRSGSTVTEILAALKEGRFYSSCGPVIKDFYVEEGTACLDCSPCSSIQFLSGCQPTKVFRGERLTHVELELPWKYHYIRASVVDGQGRRAWTNPIFLN